MQKLKFLSCIVFSLFVIQCASAYKFNMGYDINNEYLYEEDYYHRSWSDWKIKFQKNYKNEYEEIQRKNIYKKNLDYITIHNLTPGKTYQLGMNHFGDMTREEWSSKHFGYDYERSIIHKNRQKSFQIVNINISSLPESFDWRTKGAVTPVKNQGQCGSCWSFSATGSMEGAHFISTKKLVSLSEQQLVDCSTAEGDHGCFGGLMDDAFEYVIKNKGLDTESDYKYDARDGTCNKKKQKRHAATFSSYQDVPHNNEQALAAAVFQQPVSVAIEADQSDFQFYRSGIFNTQCGTNLDHGVLAVGYGVKDGMKYWIVKNSWGETWGDNGYILMAKDIASEAGQCGIAMQPSYPVV